MCGIYDSLILFALHKFTSGMAQKSTICQGFSTTHGFKACKALLDWQQKQVPCGSLPRFFLLSWHPKRTQKNTSRSSKWLCVASGDSILLHRRSSLRCHQPWLENPRTQWKFLGKSPRTYSQFSSHVWWNRRVHWAPTLPGCHDTSWLQSSALRQSYPTTVVPQLLLKRPDCMASRYRRIGAVKWDQ